MVLFFRIFVFSYLLLDVITSHFQVPSRGFPHSSVGKESACNAGDPCSIPGLGRSSGERIGYPTAVFLGFPCSSAGKESACNSGGLGSIPGLGRCPGEGKDCPLEYSGLENFMDCIVPGIAKSQRQLSDFHFHNVIIHEFISPVQISSLIFQLSCTV